MSETIVPVTYPGHPDSSLIFRLDNGDLSVRRSWPDAQWKPVAGMTGVPSEGDPNDVAVTINGDLRFGMPFYVHMDTRSFQRVRSLIRQGDPSPQNGRSPGGAPGQDSP